MYTGTLIKDLMATVERVALRTQFAALRAEQNAAQKSTQWARRPQSPVELELQMLEAMYYQRPQSERTMAGAA